MEAGIRNDLLNVILRQQPFAIEATERMPALSRRSLPVAWTFSPWPSVLQAHQKGSGRTSKPQS
jgi:hypothetical protein